MASLEKPELVTTNVRYRMPNVHPEGRKFVVIAAAICLLFALLSWETLAWPMAGITLWVAAFFRDPIRTTPKGEGLVIAPGGRSGRSATHADPVELLIVNGIHIECGNTPRLCNN